MNAGGHGIFDFIHRDPATMQPYFSASRVEPPKHSIHLGSWVTPFGSGTAEQLRQGKAFWEILDDHGIPNSVYRIPANFPPIDAKGKTLSGMGTPDLRGTYGTFTFYTDDPTAATGAVEGGEILQVEVKDNRVAASLIGPDNTFRNNSPPATEPFTVDIDPLQPVARLGRAGVHRRIVVVAVAHRGRAVARAVDEAVLVFVGAHGGAALGEARDRVELRFARVVRALREVEPVVAGSGADQRVVGAGAEGPGALGGVGEAEGPPLPGIGRQAHVTLRRGAEQQILKALPRMIRKASQDISLQAAS